MFFPGFTFLVSWIGQRILQKQRRPMTDTNWDVKHAKCVLKNCLRILVNTETNLRTPYLEKNIRKIIYAKHYLDNINASIQKAAEYLKKNNALEIRYINLVL